MAPISIPDTALATPVPPQWSSVIQAILEAMTPALGGNAANTPRAKRQKFIRLTTEQLSALINACTSQTVPPVIATSPNSVTMPSTRILAARLSSLPMMGLRKIWCPSSCIWTYATKMRVGHQPPMFKYKTNPLTLPSNSPMLPRKMCQRLHVANGNHPLWIPLNIPSGMIPAMHAY